MTDGASDGELRKVVGTDSGLVKLLGITITQATADHVEATMLVREDLEQLFGYLHGGATCALIETAGGIGAVLRSDPRVERTFGVDVHVRHRNPGLPGTLITAKADYDHTDGNKIYYNVSTYDEKDQLLSEGVVINKIVSIEYLRKRNAAAANLALRRPAHLDTGKE